MRMTNDPSQWRSGAGAPHPATRDGGPPGWFAVLASWTMWFLWGVLVKALGVLLPTVQAQFVTRTWIIGWIIAMMAGSMGPAGVFAGPLAKKFGTGAIIIVSGLLVGGAFIAAAFASNATQLALLLTLVAGPGLGFANVLTRAAVGICFTKNYSTASAVSQTGLSAAMLVGAPLAQLFLDTYGWRATLLLLGALSMHLVNCGQLLRRTLPRRDGKEYELLSTGEKTVVPSQHSNGSIRKAMARRCQDCFRFSLSAVGNLDCRLLLDAQFLLILTTGVCSIFPFEMWYIYFISHAQSKGFTPAEAAVFITYAGVGHIVLKIAHAPVVDKGIIGLRTMLAGNMMACFASLALTPWITAYWSMAVSACVFMACTSVIANLCDILVKDVLGPDRMACALGWTGIVFGVLRAAVGFFPGWVYDETGSYDLAFLILGGLQPVGLIALISLRCTEKSGNPK